MLPLTATQLPIVIPACVFIMARIDSECANVTNYVWNVTSFPVSCWSHYDGRDWITFRTSQQSLTGKYPIGTFTIQCVCEDACETRLSFAKPSTLFDPQGDELPANWINGTLTCTNIADISDTDPGTYPRIVGRHNGTITPSHNIIADKMYTYPCPGTGGHSEYIAIYNESGPVAEAHWMVV